MILSLGNLIIFVKQRLLSLLQFFLMKDVQGDTANFNEFSVSGVTYEPKGEV